MTDIHTALGEAIRLLRDRITQLENRLVLRKTGIQGADIASAGTITAGNFGNFFNITGVTTIDYMTTGGWTPGSVVFFVFADSLTVSHAAGAPPAGTAEFFLSGSADFVTGAGDLLETMFDGTYWREIARMVA